MIELIHGDCLDVLDTLKEKSINLIFADIPQGLTKNAWDVVIRFDSFWSKVNRVIKDNGVIILMTNQPVTSQAVLSNINYFRYSLVWEKTNPTGFLNAKKMPLRSHEDILVFYKKQPKYYPQKTTGHPRKVSTASHKRNSIKTSNYGNHNLVSYDSTERYQKSVLKFKSDKQKLALNATQKPVALVEWFIKSFTKEEDFVLDPCAGSGTTLEACINLNRSGIGIEKSEFEFLKAKTRLKL